MKKKAVFFILCFILILFSCNQKNHLVITYDFKPIKDIELPIPSNIYNCPEKAKIIKNDSGVFYIIISRDHVFTYNLNNQKVISDFYINVNATFLIVNLDSIFVLKNSSKNYSYKESDSMLLLIDYKGNIKQNISLKDAPLNGARYSSTDSASYISNISYNNGNLFFFFEKLFYSKLNDSAFCSVNNEYVGHIDLKDNKYYADTAIKYPELYPGRLLHDGYSIISLLPKGNYLYCGFGYTNKILKYCLETKQIDTIYAPSYFVKNEKIDINKRYALDPPTYCGLSYNKSLNCYISYVFLDNPLNNDIINGVILDSNYNKIGEYRSKIIIRPQMIDGLFYAINKEKTFSKDKKLVITIYKIIKKRVSIDSIMKPKTKKEDYCNLPILNNFLDTAYIQNYLIKKIGKSDFKAWIIPVFMSCHTCVDYLLQVYSMNVNVFSQSDVYLIAIGDNFPAIKEKLHHFNISENLGTVIIDSASNYTKAYKEFTMEHMVIFKKNRLIFAKDYYPDELDSMVLKSF